MCLLQRRDALEGLTVTRALPIFRQFLLVKLSPFKDESQCSAWEVAPNGARLNLHRELVLSIDGVEVRHAMLAIKHADYDSEESGDFRHQFLTA